MADEPKPKNDLEDVYSFFLKLSQDKNLDFDSSVKEWQNFFLNSNKRLKFVSTPCKFSSLFLLISYPFIQIYSYFEKKYRVKNLLKKRTIRRLLKLGLLQLDESVIRLSPAPINPIIGLMMISFLLFITGFYAGWIIFFSKITFHIIISSWVFGLVVGVIIGLIRDFSYNEKDLYQKINQIYHP